MHIEMRYHTGLHLFIHSPVQVTIYHSPLPTNVYRNVHGKPNRDALIDKTTSWALNESLCAHGGHIYDC